MKKILVVEDDLELAKVLVHRLEASGYEVLVACDGYEAVATFHKMKPDLIVLDILLPAGGGIFVLKTLRASHHGAFVPVVVLTALQDPLKKDEILRTGVDAYLEKPFEAEELIKTIETVLAKKG